MRLTGNDLFLALTRTGRRAASLVQRAIGTVDGRDTSYCPRLDRMAARFSGIPTRAELEAQPINTWLRKIRRLS